MKRYALAVLTLVIAIITALWIKVNHCPTDFNTLTQAKLHIEERRFYCLHIKDANFQKLVVSRRPMTQEQAIERSASLIHLDHGIVIVMMNRGDYFIEPPRLWGDLIAIGDSSILDEIGP